MKTIINPKYTTNIEYNFQKSSDPKNFLMYFEKNNQKCEVDQGKKKHNASI